MWEMSSLKKSNINGILEQHSKAHFDTKPINNDFSAETVI